jgi:hypothetical protein
MWILMRSPGFIIRSRLVSGVTALRFGLANVLVNSGSAGACEWPFRVMYAQFTGSSPPRT